jgi:hypothetical protein
VILRWLRWRPAVTDVSISQADIDGLAQSLNTLAPTLPDGQRALLSAILAVAAQIPPAEVTASGGSFGDQFAAAFTPEKATFLVRNYPPHVIR